MIENKTHSKSHKHHAYVFEEHNPNIYVTYYLTFCFE